MGYGRRREGQVRELGSAGNLPRQLLQLQVPEAFRLRVALPIGGHVDRASVSANQGGWSYWQV